MAARAGARAALVGSDATSAARRALPAAMRAGAEVDDADGVSVRVAGAAPVALAAAGHGRGELEPGAGGMTDERGQASVELVAAVPALLLAALVALQLLAAGYALTLADGAAEAGALALASGGSAAEAARAALPGWAEDSVAVSVRGGNVSVRLLPPSPFAGLADRLAVTSTASVRPAE